MARSLINIHPRGVLWKLWIVHWVAENYSAWLLLMIFTLFALSMQPLSCTFELPFVPINREFSPLIMWHGKSVSTSYSLSLFFSLLLTLFYYNIQIFFFNFNIYHFRKLIVMIKIILFYVYDSLNKFWHQLHFVFILYEIQWLWIFLKE